MSAITVDISDLAERIMGVPDAEILADLKQAQARSQSLIAEADALWSQWRDSYERDLRRYGSLTARLAKAAKPRPGKRVMR